MRTISIIGYSDSGKTTVAVAIIGEARRRGMTAAAIKVGHPGKLSGIGPASGTGSRLKDSERFTEAGASLVLLRTPLGWSVEIVDPLRDEEEIMCLPAWLESALEGTDLLVIEGRRVEGALVVQTLGPERRYKVPPEQCDLVLENAPTDPVPARLIEMIFG